MTTGSLMKVESIAECSHLEHSAIFLTCIKRQSGFKIIFGPFESGSFTCPHAHLNNDKATK